MQVSTMGIDLAKNLFVLHGVDHNGKTVLRKNAFPPPVCPVHYSASGLFNRYGSVFIQPPLCPPLQQRRASGETYSSTVC